MLKKSKFFLVTLLALILCTAGIATAFATGLNGDGALMTTNEETPAQAAITKHFRLPVGTNVPNLTFHFTAEKVSVDGNTSAAGLATMPVLNTANLTIGYTATDVATDVSADHIVSIVKETDDIFAGVVFPHAGIYVYEITEEADTNGITDQEWLSYSAAKYTITVYVANNAAGDGTYIYALGTMITTPDNNEQAAGNKVDPTPGGDDTNYFYSQMIFTNDYAKVNGPVDPERPDPLTDSTLHVGKRVGGDFASREQFFDYVMTITAPSILEDIPAYYRAYVVKDGALVDPTNMADASLIGTDSGGTYLKISTTGTTEFRLRDGKELVFVDTPVGTVYTLEEMAATNYVPSYIITTSGEQGANVTGTISAGILTGEQFVGELENRADFLNTRDSVTPTGLNLNDLPFIVLIGLGVGALVVFVVVKASRNKSKYRA